LIVVELVFVSVTLPPVTVPTGVGPKLTVLGFTLSTFDASAAVDDAAISAAASMKPAPSFFMTHLTSMETPALIRDASRIVTLDVPGGEVHMHGHSYVDRSRS
jgi:hypothetical protein